MAIIARLWAADRVKKYILAKQTIIFIEHIKIEERTVIIVKLTVSITK